MKILYIAKERSEAQSAATALRDLTPNVKVLWASRFDQAAVWIDQQPDLAALVVDAQVDDPGCARFLTHVRRQGVNAPVVVIAPQGSSAPAESLHAGADDYVAKTPSLPRELAAAVSRAAARARVLGAARWDHLRLDRTPSSTAAQSVSLDSQQAATNQAAADRLAECQAEFDAALAEAIRSQTSLEELLQQERATRGNLEEALAQARTALQDAEQRHQSTTRAGGQLAERLAQYEVRMAQADAKWEMVDEQFRKAATEVEQARRNQASAAADVERLTRREADLCRLLAEANASCGALANRLAVVETAFEAAAEQTSRDLLAAAERASQREVEFEGLLSQELAIRGKVEEKLSRAETALRDAQEGHFLALGAVTNELTDSKSRFQVELSQIAAACDYLKEQLRDAEDTIEAARDRHASTAAEVARLTEREATLESQLSDAAAAHNAVELELTASRVATQDAIDRAAGERLAAASKAAEREASLDARIRQECAARAGVEQKLTLVKSVLRDTEARHLAAVTAAAAELSELQRRFDSEVVQSIADRDGFTRQLRDADLALGDLQGRHSSAVAEIERLTEREATLASQLSDAAAARNVLDVELTAARLAMEDATERATRERLAAASQAAEREANLDARIRQECAARASVEQKLTFVESALRDAEQRHLSAATDAAGQLAELQARFDTGLAQSTEARDGLTRQLHDADHALGDLQRRHSSAVAEIERLTEREAALASQLADAEAVRTTLDCQLTQAAVAIEDAETRATHESQLAAERQADIEFRLAQEISSREVLEREIAEVRTTVEAAEDQLAGERADYAVQFAEMQERLDRTRQTAEDDVRRLAAELAVAQHELDQARSGFHATLDRISSEHAAALVTLEAAVADRDVQIEEQATRYSASVQAAAIERARLQSQADENLAEVCRQFEESPLPMCRCTPDGALIHANRAFAELVGHRTVGELRSSDFGAAVFESPDDLPLLIDRCVSSAATESIETTWKTKEGSRLSVRVSASAPSAHAIEIIAEDLTNLRALQERLVQAQRMEAVGRLASEVAVTCVNLLSDVHQDAQRWVKAVGPETPLLRHQGEMLLDDVTRATGFLRQLAAYGDEETSAMSPVNLNKVLRDLGPVLKRVAGDDVELELPKTNAPITVDVQADRVERLLVNLAGYGRERMPFGGRLKIELATVVLDHQFIAKYPNVRQGPHALITVTEVRRTTRAEGPLRLRELPADVTNDRGPSEKPGVDLGALQGLIRECGGHLWVTAAPHGDMVVQIHLPLRHPDEQNQPRPAARRASQSLTGSGMVRH